MMQAHERVSIDEKSFACEICWRRFARENDLKTHLWVHTQTQEKPYSCDLCHRAFPCATTRNNHFKRTHKDVVSPIVSSPASVHAPSPQQQQQQALQVIVPQQPRSVVSSQQHATVVTSQQLSVATSQQQHLAVSTNSESSLRKNSPPCDICGKTFAFKYYVKIHQTVHTKEKPYICDLCHKTFSQASSRNRHRKEMHKEGADSQNGLQLAINDGSEKIVSQFDVLGKQFPSSRGALYEVHPVPETKEKPYSCDLCHKRFTQASSRNRHLKEMHKDGETPLPPGETPPGTRRAIGVLTRNVGPACGVCCKRFPCKSLLEIHMRVHTKERPYSCEICYKTFTQVSSRNFHRRKMHKDLILSLIPPPSQQQQQQQEQQQLALKQTTLVESGGKLVPECGVCGKRFPCKSLMEIHMRVHTKERPYSCDLCFKTFTQVSSRNFHRRKIHKEQIASPNSQTSSSSQSSLPQPLALPAPPSTPLQQPVQLPDHQKQHMHLSQQLQSQLSQSQSNQQPQQSQLPEHQKQQMQLAQQLQSQLTQSQSTQQQPQTRVTQHQQQTQLSQQQSHTPQSQVSQQQHQQQSQVAQQHQQALVQQQSRQLPQQGQTSQTPQSQLNQQHSPLSPISQQAQLQHQCQITHHRGQSPLSPQQQTPSLQPQLSPLSQQTPSLQPQLSPLSQQTAKSSPSPTQQQQNLQHSHALHQVQQATSPPPGTQPPPAPQQQNPQHSHVLHQVQRATSPSLVGDTNDKNFHCKMCASGSFTHYK